MEERATRGSVAGAAGPPEAPGPNPVGTLSRATSGVPIPATLPAPSLRRLGGQAPVSPFAKTMYQTAPVRVIVRVGAVGVAHRESMMTTSQMSEVIQHLCRTVLLQDGAGLTDGQLLEGFVSRRDEAALAALVRRHGPMVWAVCRRVLLNYHDAENAFQATFLVLVRKAASIVPRAMVANWLYGVAHQTALKARALATKRRTRERQVTQMPEPAAAEPNLWPDLQPLLDQELSRLPDKYRVVVVLCDLEGKTRKEAARQLGVPEGTVAGRLARARTMLAKRLTRHGLAVSGGALAAALAQNVAPAAVPIAVLSSTIEAATLFAAGSAAAAGLISDTAAALTEGVVKTMLLAKLKVSKLKVATAVFLAAGLVTSAARLVILPLPAGELPAPETATPATQDEGKPHTAPRPVFVHEDGAVMHLAWSPNSKIVATVGVNNEPIESRYGEGKKPQWALFNVSTIKLWDARTGELKRSLGAERKTTIYDIAFSPDGKTAAAVLNKYPDPPRDHGKNEVRIVDAETLAVKRTIEVEGGGIQAIAFSPDGKTLAIGGGSLLAASGSFVKLWDVQNERMKGGTKFEDRRTVMTNSALVADRAGRGVDHLTFSPDGKVLAGANRSQVLLFDGQTGDLKQALDAHSRSVRGIAFSPDSRTLVSGSEDKTVKLWDMQTGKLRQTLQGNKGMVAAVAFSPDGQLLATGGTVRKRSEHPEDDKSIPELILWDTKTWKVKETLPDKNVYLNTRPNAYVRTLAFSPDGKTLAISYGRIGEGLGLGQATSEIYLHRLE
jgi:RNA polymerase sigma factor (sigma-70 family)